MAIIDPETQADMLTNQIAQQIRVLRAKEGLLQTELAERCHLRQQTLSKLENGDYRRNEFIVSALKVADYFKIEPTIFFFGNMDLSSEALKAAKLYDRASKKNKRQAMIALESE